MAKVLFLPTLLLLALGILCFALTARPAKPANEVVFTDSGEIHTLDPAAMSWSQDIRAAMGLWEGLAAYDPKTLKPVPGVADRWTISPDGLDYTFHLRNTAKWSNGDPVTAADFVFAWKRTLQPATAAQYLFLFFNIKGAEDFYNALAAGEPANFSTVGIAAPNASTLTVHLAHPCTYFLDLVAFPPFFPLNQKSMQPFWNAALQNYEPQFQLPPALITDGPYQLADWKFHQFLLLKPNPFYWDRQTVKLDRLKITAFESDKTGYLAYFTHKVDILSFTPQEELGQALVAQARAGRRDDIHYGPVFGTYYYIFNCTKKPFNDPRVRRAFALAIDKNQIVDRVTGMHQRPLNVIVPPNAVPGYTSPQGLDQNVAEAKRLLADAGYPDGRGLPEIEFLTNKESALHVQIGQACRQMWEEVLGAHVRSREVESKSFHEDRVHQNFMIARGGWYGDYLDPTTFLDLCRTGNPNNDGQFSDPAFDALMNNAAQEPNPQKRFALLSKAESLLVTQDMPLLPLYQYGDGPMFDPKKIAGLYPNVRSLILYKYLHRAP